MNRFAVLFAAFASLALALTVKEDLTARCTNMQLDLTRVMVDNGLRGYDYFALVLNNTIQRVEYLRASIQTLHDLVTKEQAGAFVNQTEDLEKIVKEQLRFPALREIYKGGALYLAAMKEVTNETSAPFPVDLKRQVADIIAQEGTVQSFGLSPAEHHLMKEASKKLDEMYDDLLKDIREKNIPTPDDFALLEYDMNLKIMDLKHHNKKEEIKKCDEALNHFRTSTYFLAKIFPIDSRTRATQFLQAAPQHYKEYLALKVLFWLKQ